MNEQNKITTVMTNLFLDLCTRSWFRLCIDM